MFAFHRLRKLTTEAFSDLYAAFCTAEEWLEEGDLVGEVRSGFDALARPREVRLEKHEKTAALRN